jgi:hypothetical protein
MTRRTAFSNRDYVTIAVFASLWAAMVIQFVQTVVAHPRALGPLAAAVAFWSWVCWTAITYRRVALYVMPAILLGFVVAEGLELVPAIEPGEVFRYGAGVLMFAVPCAAVLYRRKFYA